MTQSLRLASRLSEARKGLKISSVCLRGTLGLALTILTIGCLLLSLCMQRSMRVLFVVLCLQCCVPRIRPYSIRCNRLGLITVGSGLWLSIVLMWLLLTRPAAWNLLI